LSVSHPPTPPVIYTLSLHDALPIFRLLSQRDSSCPRNLQTEARRCKNHPELDHRGAARHGLPHGNCHENHRESHHGSCRDNQNRGSSPQLVRKESPPVETCWDSSNRFRSAQDYSSAFVQTAIHLSNCR